MEGAAELRTALTFEPTLGSTGQVFEHRQWHPLWCAEQLIDGSGEAGRPPGILCLNEPNRDRFSRAGEVARVECGEDRTQRWASFKIRRRKERLHTWQHPGKQPDAQRCSLRKVQLLRLPLETE
ncbi:hypothetical protein GCM10008957_30490 [Deinococcus ruber]|uniref:Uncharacterized protein n=1 Tax=Deinococcus ruber TaxID=1848197 RepID=A0A918F790_9DEIO|nr:hypothetical protein GCM10008957_30490 [Deinococcus ruber]